MVEGLQQLHNLGYSHGFLRFNHVVVNLKGNDVRLVGFGNSRPINAPIKTMQEHEDIFTPKYWRLRQGDPFLDIYAASVIIFLTYCWDQHYFKVFDIDQLIRLAKDKLKDLNFPESLKTIVNKTILWDKTPPMMRVETLLEEVKKIDW